MAYFQIIDGAQLTVVWHVDDEGSGAMKMKRGKIHEYLGMQFDFSVAGQVKITMFDYVQEMLEDSHKYDPSKNFSRTPAVDHLFKVRDDQPKLNEHKPVP